MNVEKRIERFNKRNEPFYLVNHGSEYSLCFLLGGKPTVSGDYGQFAFDRYAVSIGEPVETDGWYNYGDGYDWEYVFKKAFESDNNLHSLRFDSEASGFFCFCEDLATLESFGSRFKALCENKPAFEKVVAEAMTEADQMRQESEKECQTIKEFIEQHLNCSFDMITPMGYVRLDHRTSWIRRTPSYDSGRRLTSLTCGVLASGKWQSDPLQYDGWFAFFGRTT